RTDLEDRVVRTGARRLDDRLEHLAVDEVVLAQALPGRQTVSSEVPFDRLRPQVRRVELRERLASPGPRRALRDEPGRARGHEGRASRSWSARVPARKRW